LVLSLASVLKVLKASLKCSELATLTQRDDDLKKKPRTRRGS
jgi:hypothetical protein